MSAHVCSEKGFFSSPSSLRKNGRMISLLHRRRNPLKTLAVTHQSPSQSRAVKHQSSRRLSLRSGDLLPLIPRALWHCFACRVRSARNAISPHQCQSSTCHAGAVCCSSVSYQTPLFSGMDKRFCSFSEGGGPAHALHVMKTSDHLCQT